MKFSLDRAKTIMDLFKLAWAQFKCEHFDIFYQNILQQIIW